MGIIRAIAGAIGGGLADQWLEVIEADNMTDTTVCTKGTLVRKNEKRFGNKKGSSDIISDGSVIHVYPNQCMLLLDGGKIVDFTAEEGYYKVSNTTAPSLFSGHLGGAIKEAFSRVKYSGVPSAKQKAIYVNLQEMKGIKFGTQNPVNYFDNFYNSELFLRAHGTYSFKVTNPVLFYTEVISKAADRVEVADINEQYLSEFLEALQAAMNQMSVDGIRISHVASRGRELSKYMADILDEDWKKMRGMEVQAVGIASISYDEQSQKLINMRNQGAMLGDASVREGYIQGAMARGFESAGSNPGGSATAFMGMGVGMQAGGGFFGAASQTNREQMKDDQAAKAARGGWTCPCGTANEGRFCANCGKPQPGEPAAEGWSCACGATNRGRFCSECGKPRPEGGEYFCPECGQKNPLNAKFCSQCGNKRPE
ncbi:MAG: SPFH domain-containing protein [Eubacteriales bacterium]